jgi:HK97 gp10 family phage protein
MSLLEAAVKLVAADVAIRVAAGHALERVAQRVEDTARAELGVYQPEVGPFPEWAELAQSTQDERERLGYPADEPLLRDGSLRDSISHEVHDLEAVIGSTSDIAEYHEFGTSKMPPRPFIGPAAERNHDVILKELGGAIVAGIIGDQAIHPSLGYDRVIERAKD